MFLTRRILEAKLLRLLADDLGQGDITTALIIPEGVTSEARVMAKEAGIVAGIEETRVLLESQGIIAETLVEDGEKAGKNQALLKMFGDTKTILSTERTLLNILSRMSGIATTTRELVNILKKARLKTRVACTRKTAPGLLYFDKKAVMIGGGDTHRLHLDDMILIKDNHIAAVGGIEKAIRKALEKASFSKKIEVEVANIDDALTAAKAGADIIMFDNFSPTEIKKACMLLKKAKLYGNVLLEASGGITKENIVAFASSGVNVVSLGEITSKAITLDVSLEITNVRRK